MESLSTKKGIHVSRHCPAVLHNYILAFNLMGVQYVEPAFAGLRQKEGGEVHGIAFCMDRESEVLLDRVEGVGMAYRKEWVTLKGYHGKQMDGFVYLPIKDMEGLPSARYLELLCKGAREAGLAEHYIASLTARDVYTPGKLEEVVRIRKKREEQLRSLPEITSVQLETEGRDGYWTSVLGVVVTLPTHPHPMMSIVWQYAVCPTMEPHHNTPGLATDVTNNLVKHHRGQTKLPLQHQDQQFPVVAQLSVEEVDAIQGWLDHFMLCGGSTLVGRLKEFTQRQSGQ